MTAEIGLTSVNKQKFDIILAEQKPDDGTLTVTFQQFDTQNVAVTWDLGQTDMLYISVSPQIAQQLLWINWYKPLTGNVSENIEKGFCIPLHNIEWMRYAPSPSSSSS